ncbi:MAG: hypothetical protein WEC12_05705 [Balneolaceae bacterium]
MINFHTITLEAHELFDPETGSPNSQVCHSSVGILVNAYGETRNITFHEGDSADVILTDGTHFLMLYENGQWICCQFLPKSPVPGSYFALVTLYGPYPELEEALTDLVSKRNYLASVN